MSQQPPGWYVDARGITRWWDGTRWTEQTMAAPVPKPVTPATPPTPVVSTGSTTTTARRGPGLVVGLLAAAVVVAAVVFAFLIIGKADSVYSAEEPTAGPSASTSSGATDKVDIAYPSTRYVKAAPHDAAKSAYCKLAKTDTTTMTPVQYAMWTWEQADTGTPDDMPGYVRRDWEKTLTALYRKTVFTSTEVISYADGTCGTD